MTRRAPLKERIIEKIHFADSGCWEWTGALNQFGYGVVYNKTGSSLAHRASFQVFLQPPQTGMHLDHLCRVRKCINPLHLEEVTARENTARTDAWTNGAKKRVANLLASKTHCLRGHLLAGDNLYTVPKTGHRQCRSCRAFRRNK